MKHYKEKPNFDNVTDEQIAYMIQCCERDVTRLNLLERALTEREKSELQISEEAVIAARKELQKRAQAVKQGRLF